MVRESSSGWNRFWERGGFWRALLLAAVYYLLYQLLSWLVGLFVGDGGGIRGEKGSAADLFFGTAMPIVLASILLVAFAASLGWLKELFARQQLGGRGWMWVAIILVLAINVSALFSIDYGAAGIDVVGTWLLTGLFVGFAEEVLTRGFVINLMRKAGHGEIAVALASAGIFAAMHLGNLFTSDQGVAQTLLQVVYTFFFGICMYLALRLSRLLVVPILLHASTDPTLALHGTYPNESLIGLLPTFGTFLVIGVGVVLLIALIVSERRRANSDAVTR